MSLERPPRSDEGWAVRGGDLDQDVSIELVVSAPEREVGDTIGAGSVFVLPAGHRSGLLQPTGSAPSAGG